MTEQTWFYLSFADGELPAGTQFDISETRTETRNAPARSAFHG